MGYTITLFAGILLAIFAFFKFKQSMNFLKTGGRATATVIELETVHSSDGGPTYKPIFRFSTIKKQSVTYRHHTSSSPAAWDIGEKTTIVYDYENPENAKLLTYFGAFGWTIILLSIAMPCLVIGGGYLLAKPYLIDF